MTKHDIPIVHTLTPFGDEYTRAAEPLYSSTLEPGCSKLSEAEVISRTKAIVEPHVGKAPKPLADGYLYLQHDEANDEWYVGSSTGPKRGLITSVAELGENLRSAGYHAELGGPLASLKPRRWKSVLNIGELRSHHIHSTDLTVWALERDVFRELKATGSVSLVQDEPRGAGASSIPPFFGRRNGAPAPASVPALAQFHLWPILRDLVQIPVPTGRSHDTYDLKPFLASERRYSELCNLMFRAIGFPDLTVSVQKNGCTFHRWIKAGRLPYLFERYDDFSPFSPFILSTDQMRQVDEFIRTNVQKFWPKQGAPSAVREIEPIFDAATIAAIQNEIDFEALRRLNPSSGAPITSIDEPDAVTITAILDRLESE